MKSANSPSQTSISNYFDPVSISTFIDNEDILRTEINRICGNEKTKSVAPIMKILYENAQKNAACTSKHANRHDETVKKFASSLFCIVGKSGYDLLLTNLGSALPSLSCIQRSVSSHKKIKEGDYQFDELSEHLKDFKAPPFINIHLDDTRLINRVEYDPITDRFVGFCLPIKDGLPLCDAFQFQTFQEINAAFETEVVAQYAHCVVAQPIDISCPACVLFVLGTDSTYSSETIVHRWNYVENELGKRGIQIISHGADGAGPFLKGMIDETRLFTKSVKSNVPTDWSFFLMPKLKTTALHSQDTIHILAKLRTRLITPTNLIVLGSETAYRAHLEQLINTVSKDHHGLTMKSINHKDKQNYDSINAMVSKPVENCLRSLSKLRPKGTLTYLFLMRNIRDAFFNKALSPLE